MFFSLSVMAFNALHAEYLAFWWAIHLASFDPSLNYHFEMDYATIYTNLMCSKEMKVNWVCINKQRSIRNMLTRLNWRCSHIYREVNKVAKFLAKNAMLSEEGIISKRLTTRLKTLVHGDTLGMPYIRHR